MIEKIVSCLILGMTILGVAMLVKIDMSLDHTFAVSSPQQLQWEYASLKADAEHRTYIWESEHKTYHAMRVYSLYRLLGGEDTRFEKRTDLQYLINYLGSQGWEMIAPGSFEQDDAPSDYWFKRYRTPSV